MTLYLFFTALSWFVNGLWKMITYYTLCLYISLGKPKFSKFEKFFHYSDILLWVNTVIDFWLNLKTHHFNRVFGQVYKTHISISEITIIITFIELEPSIHSFDVLMALIPTTVSNDTVTVLHVTKRSEYIIVKNDDLASVCLFQMPLLC